MDFGVFIEFARDDHLLEFWRADEMEFPAIGLLGAWRPACIGNGIVDLPVRAEQAFQHGGLSTARGRGEHDKKAAALQLKTHD